MSDLVHSGDAAGALQALERRAEWITRRSAMLRSRWPAVEAVVNYLFERGHPVYHDPEGDPVETWIDGKTGERLGEHRLWWLADAA